MNDLRCQNAIFAPTFAMRSMTGFGRGEAVEAGIAYQIEVGSVNRKQADVAVGIPRELASLEMRVRKAVLARISRGRVSATIKTEPIEDRAGSGMLEINQPLAQAYIDGLKEIGSASGVELSISAGDLLRAPGVFEISDSRIEPDAAWTGIETAINAGLDQMIAMRESEGEHLQSDLAARISQVENAMGAIAELAPEVTKHHHRQLSGRLEQAGLPLPLDDDRLLKEIGLFAERCDISEELTRLQSHIVKFREFLTSDEPTGRSLDFLSQELFREFNTIGAKANSATIAQHVVSGKTEVEKIREQVQNVE